MVETGEVGDVITRDAMTVWRLPAFTVTRVLCNACTASPSGYIDRIESNYDFLAAHRIESDRNEKFGIVSSLELTLYMPLTILNVSIKSTRNYSCFQSHQI